MSESKDAERDDAVTPASTSSTEPDDKESADYPTPETTGEVIPPTLKRREDWYVTNADDKRAYAPWKAGTERFVSWLPPRDGNDKDTDYAGTFEDAREWVDEYGAFDYYGTRSLATAPDEKRLVFLDFDDVRDPESGEIHPQAWKMVSETGLFATLSSSGTGIHGYVWAESVPPEMKPSFVNELDGWEHTDNPELEFYAQDRFIVFTGEHLEDTATEIPTRSEMVHTFINDHSEPKHERMATEPERDRSEIEDVETTTDTEVVMDAISHTTPSDVRLDSDKTGEAKEGVVRDPSYENSDSGERILDYEDGGFFDRNASEPFDILDLVAAEEGIISTPSDSLEGDDFWDAVDVLRERGAPIPEYEDATQIEDDKLDTTGLHDEEVWDMFRAVYEEGEMDKGVIRDSLAYFISNTKRFVAVEGKENGLFYYNDDKGVYESDGASNKLAGLLRRKLRHHINNHEVNEITAAVKQYSFIEEINGCDGHLNLKNGVLEVPTRTLHPKTDDNGRPQFQFKNVLDVEYDPDAECGRWEDFIGEVLRHPSHGKKVQEYAGYCLMDWETPFDKALYVVGRGSSGKSTMLNTIKSIFGREASTALSPQQITDEKFHRHKLKDSMVNISNDLDDAVINNVGLWKRVVGNDPIAARGMYEEGEEFIPRAKHIYAANKLPKASHDDDAFYRRVLLVATPYQFKGDDVDTDLEDKLKEQKSGILNWMLDGLDRLLDQQHFTAQLPPEMVKGRWMAWADSPQRFLKVGISRVDDTITTHDEIREHYEAFCDERSLNPTDYEELKDEIKKLKGVRPKRTTRDGEQKRGFKGLELIPQDDWPSLVPGGDDDESESTED